MGNLLATGAWGKVSALDFLQFDKVDIDSWSFKVFSKFSVAIFLLASLLVMSTTHFGSPITCDDKEKFTESYCWLHGSYNLIGAEDDAKRFFGHKCIRDPKYSKLSIEERDRDTEYYQWVVFMLFIHGALFLFPSKLWQYIEGGLLEQFGNKSEKMVMVITDHDKFQEVAEKHAKFFKSLSPKKNNEYFYYFVFCELLNCVVVVVNYYIINEFLGGRFSTYGADVIAYSQTDLLYKDDVYDPMCDAFPTLVNCRTNNFGVGGIVQTQSTLCILGQNIINEKIYLFLWFWFVFMYITAIFTFISYVAILTLPSYRRYQILYHTRSKCSQKKYVDALAHNWSNISTIGNWFILHQIGRNSNAYFFRRFLAHLIEDEKVEVVVDNDDTKKEGSIDDTRSTSTEELTRKETMEMDLKNPGFAGEFVKSKSEDKLTREIDYFS